MSAETVVFIYALMAFSNSLMMTKTDQNMWDLWQIVCNKRNFNVRVVVGFIVWIVC